MKVDIKSDGSDAVRHDLRRFALQPSPVCDTVHRPVPASVERVMHR